MAVTAPLIILFREHRAAGPRAAAGPSGSCVRLREHGAHRRGHHWLRALAHPS